MKISMASSENKYICAWKVNWIYFTVTIVTDKTKSPCAIFIVWKSRWKKQSSSTNYSEYAVFWNFISWVGVTYPFTQKYNICEQRKNYILNNKLLLNLITCFTNLRFFFISFNYYQLIQCILTCYILNNLFSESGHLKVFYT